MIIKKNLPVIYSYMREYKSGSESGKAIEIEYLQIYQTKGVLISGTQKPISKLL